MYGYVYVTINNVNGKIYVGQKKSTYFIITYHGSGKMLKQAISKYGVNHFDTFLIGFYNSQESLDAAEVFWIDYFSSNVRDVGYNIAKGGRDSRRYIR